MLDIHSACWSTNPRGSRLATGHLPAASADCPSHRRSLPGRRECDVLSTDAARGAESADRPQPRELTVFFDQRFSRPLWGVEPQALIALPFGGLSRNRTWVQSITSGLLLPSELINPLKRSSVQTHPTADAGMSLPVWTHEPEPLTNRPSRRVSASPPAHEEF